MKHKEVSPLLQTHDAVIRTFFCFRKHFEWSWVGREGDSADNTIYSSVDSRGTTDQTAKSWTHTRRDQYQKSRGESGGAFQYIIHSTSPHLRQLPNTFMKWSLDLVVVSFSSYTKTNVESETICWYVVFVLIKRKKMELQIRSSTLYCFGVTFPASSKHSTDYYARVTNEMKSLNE